MPVLTKVIGGQVWRAHIFTPSRRFTGSIACALSRRRQFIGRPRARYRRHGVRDDGAPVGRRWRHLRNARAITALAVDISSRPSARPARTPARRSAKPSPASTRSTIFGQYRDYGDRHFKSLTPELHMQISGVSIPLSIFIVGGRAWRHTSAPEAIAGGTGLLPPMMAEVGRELARAHRRCLAATPDIRRARLAPETFPACGFGRARRAATTAGSHAASHDTAFRDWASAFAA